VTANLILIASYPKSGNTWVRLFFENLLRKEGTPVSINDIRNGLYGFERRLLFDSEAPAAAADLLPEEVENLLPNVYAQWAIEANGPVLVKVHDRARRTTAGPWLFPPEHVRAVLYLARHPFDVAVSYAHHLNIPVSDAVEHLCREDHIIAGVGRSLPLPLAERPGSWNSNVGSWLDAKCYPVTLMRYEDLYSNPLEGFTRLAESAGIEAQKDNIALSIAACSFERLRSEEQAHGFRERHLSSTAFFRKGHPQTWKGALDDTLRKRLASCCAPAMKRLGYHTDGTAGTVK
jgi:aryl sulfotransferase